MIELISMIKSTQALLHQSQSVYLEAIKASVYSQVQYFVNNSLHDALKWAHKKKKADLLRHSLDTLLIYCSDEVIKRCVCERERENVCVYHLVFSLSLTKLPEGH